MVLRVPAHALIPNHRLAGLHALDQAQSLQLVEDPVHARTAHSPALAVSAQGVLDLHRGQGALLAVEQFHHRTASATALMSSRGQCDLGAVDPVAGSDLAAHATMVET
jgi:hypothetical protein